MHMHLQRFQRPENGRIMFGVKCVLVTTPEERALMEKYQAVDVAHLSVEHVSMLNGMMAGGLQEWRDDVRRISAIESSWFESAEALASYLSNASGYRTDAAEGDVCEIGYISEEFGFMRGGRG